jgi:hypothetical protein
MPHANRLAVGIMALVAEEEARSGGGAAARAAVWSTCASPTAWTAATSSSACARGTRACRWSPPRASTRKRRKRTRGASAAPPCVSAPFDGDALLERLAGVLHGSAIRTAPRRRASDAPAVTAA